ncbi:hypothetical protein [Clostridium fallax]|nr:hypothetical protein [Clostridium fallax]
MPGLDSYVAKYMDENGCSFEDACKELGINYPDAFIKKDTEIYD